MGKPFKKAAGLAGYPLSISGVYPIDDEEISTGHLEQLAVYTTYILGYPPSQ